MSAEALEVPGLPGVCPYSLRAGTVAPEIGALGPLGAARWALVPLLVQSGDFSLHGTQRFSGWHGLDASFAVRWSVFLICSPLCERLRLTFRRGGETWRSSW